MLAGLSNPGQRSLEIAVAVVRGGTGKNPDGDKITITFRQPFQPIFTALQVRHFFGREPPPGVARKGLINFKL